MDIEIKVDEKYTESKIVIYTNQVNEEITNIIDSISSINQKSLKAYKDDKMYILNQKDIETIYSENGKIILGTLIINFKSGNKSYASRRYIPKIKEFLEI